jgi:hypothetical protein
MTLSLEKKVPTPDHLMKKFNISEAEMNVYFVTRFEYLARFNGKFVHKGKVLKPQPPIKRWVLGLKKRDFHTFKSLSKFGAFVNKILK